jgi:hypothetical protein
LVCRIFTYDDSSVQGARHLFQAGGEVDSIANGREFQPPF